MPKSNFVCMLTASDSELHTRTNDEDLILQESYTLNLKMSIKKHLKHRNETCSNSFLMSPEDIGVYY